MARMRMVKPDIRKSLTVSSWPIPVRWTFVGLFGYLDDHGRGYDELRLIKAELYPLDDDITLKKLAQHLEIIEASGPLCRYQVGPASLLHITTWTEHQKVSHPTDSRIAPCPIHEPFANPSGDDPEASRIILPRAGAGARGSGNREQGTGMAPNGAAQETTPESVTPLRPRDELFDAVADACAIEVATLTQTGRGALNRAVKDLRAVGATPAQVTLRSRNYRQQYPNTSLTPPALAKHWASLTNTPRDDNAATGWMNR